MKTNSTQKVPTLGEFITRVYDVFGKRKAEGIVRFAIKTHMVEFRGKPHTEID